MSSNDKSESNDFREEAESATRRAEFECLPAASFVPGTVQERLMLLFEMKELAFALAGAGLDLRSVSPGDGPFLL